MTTTSATPTSPLEGFVNSVRDTFARAAYVVLQDDRLVPYSGITPEVLKDGQTVNAATAVKLTLQSFPPVAAMLLAQEAASRSGLTIWLAEWLKDRNLDEPVPEEVVQRIEPIRELWFAPPFEGQTVHDFCRWLTEALVLCDYMPDLVQRPSDDEHSGLGLFQSRNRALAEARRAAAT